MKVTRFGPVDANATAGSGSATGTAGGDLGGGFPAPSVTGIQGTPVCVTTPTVGQLLGFNGTEWCPITIASGGLTYISDGVVTVAPTTAVTVPLGGVVDAGGGIAALKYLTSVYGEQAAIHTVAAAGAAQTLDCSIANIFDLTLTANCTLTITNAPASGLGGTIVVILRQGGAGSFTVTWPGSVVWQNPTTGLTGGSAPTLFTAVGALNIVELATLDGGTTWGGSAPILRASVSPLTTKGDLWGFSSVDARVPVGSDGQVPTADSTAALGISYQTPVVGPQHAHVNNVVFSGDGATTVFVLPAAPVDAYSIAVFVTASRSQDWTLSGGLLDTLTFGTAPPSAANNIVVDIVAAL